jgi:Protein of unknown function (DUF2971)
MPHDPIYRNYNLPLALEMALQRFGRWSDDQLLREQAVITPVAPLYHYTGRDALKGILENQHLWCFSHAQQDDREEFQYSLGIARRELERVGMRGEEFAKEFCICVEDLVAKNNLTIVFNYYLFSLSRKRDSATQWSEYDDSNRGFCIGFAPKLFLPDQQTLNPRANDNAHVGRVIYGDAKTAYRHRKAIVKAADITHRVADANRALLSPTSVHSDYINAMAKEYIARQLVWRSITAKRVRWERQSEVRFVTMNQSKNFAGLTKTHNGRTYVTYALPLRDGGSIAEIMLGPLAPNDAEQWVRDQLATLGYPAVNITRSHIIP